MGIPVKCPNGHVFKVKEKYAGKKGYCPMCPGKVAVQVPDTLSTMSSSEAASKTKRKRSGDDHGESVLHGHEKDISGSTSGSLLNSSLVRQKVLCNKCGARVPSWYASCSECGEFLESG